MDYHVLVFPLNRCNFFLVCPPPVPGEFASLGGMEALEAERVLAKLKEAELARKEAEMRKVKNDAGMLVCAAVPLSIMLFFMHATTLPLLLDHLEI